MSSASRTLQSPTLILPTSNSGYKYISTRHPSISYHRWFEARLVWDRVSRQRESCAYQVRVTPHSHLHRYRPQTQATNTYPHGICRWAIMSDLKPDRWVSNWWVSERELCILSAGRTSELLSDTNTASGYHEHWLGSFLDSMDHHELIYVTPSGFFCCSCQHFFCLPTLWSNKLLRG